MPRRRKPRLSKPPGPVEPNIQQNEEVCFDPNHWSATREGRQKHFEEVLHLRPGELDVKLCEKRRRQELLSLGRACDQYWKGVE
jgi:hypothetical protein